MILTVPQAMENLWFQDWEERGRPVDNLMAQPKSCKSCKIINSACVTEYRISLSVTFQQG